MLHFLNRTFDEKVLEVSEYDANQLLFIILNLCYVLKLY